MSIAFHVPHCEYCWCMLQFSSSASVESASWSESKMPVHSQDGPQNLSPSVCAYPAGISDTPLPSCKPLLMCVKWAAHCVGSCRGRWGVWGAVSDKGLQLTSEQWSRHTAASLLRRGGAQWITFCCTKGGRATMLA